MPRRVLSQPHPVMCVQVLRLHSCELVSDVGIGGLCAGAAGASLTHLDVRGCERITDDGAASIGNCLKQLQYLSLEHCHLIGDRCAFAAWASLVSYKPTAPLHT